MKTQSFDYEVRRVVENQAPEEATAVPKEPGAARFTGTWTFQSSDRIVPEASVEIILGSIHGALEKDFRARTGRELSDRFGTGVKGGLRFGGRLGIHYSYMILGVDAERIDVDGEGFDQKLKYGSAWIDYQFPIWEYTTSTRKERFSLIPSVFYAANARLLDENADGYRNGSGWGLGIALMASGRIYPTNARGLVKKDYRHRPRYYGRVGITINALTFEEFEVTGFPTESISVRLINYALAMSFGVAF